MKYIITEGMDKSQIIKAGKARLDVTVIAKKNSYKEVKIPTKFGVKEKKYEKPIQYLIYRKNAKVWDKTLSDLKNGSTVLIQYPLLNTALDFYKIIEKHSKRLSIIALIHDMEIIRFEGDKTKSKAFVDRVTKNDTGVLKSVHKVISHNHKMTEKIASYGVDQKNIIDLEIFDYIDKKNQKSKVSKDENIVLAGNFIAEKAGYVKDLKKIEGASFNLYGINFDDSYKGENINYKGSFMPDQLTENMAGSFGLVWDGNTSKTCDGLYGRYLKLNNPHKLSLYLSSYLPVIIWEEAAEADFIEKNHCGLTVKSLSEIPKQLKKLSESDYAELAKNAAKIAKKLKSGYYLEKALRKAEK